MQIQQFAQKALVTRENSILLIHYSANKYGNENSITGTWGFQAEGLSLVKNQMRHSYVKFKKKQE